MVNLSNDTVCMKYIVTMWRLLIQKKNLAIRIFRGCSNPYVGPWFRCFCVFGAKPHSSQNTQINWRTHGLLVVVFSVPWFTVMDCFLYLNQDGLSQRETRPNSNKKPQNFPEGNGKIQRPRAKGHWMNKKWKIIHVYKYKYKYKYVYIYTLYTLYTLYILYTLYTLYTHIQWQIIVRYWLLSGNLVVMIKQLYIQ